MGYEDNSRLSELIGRTITSVEHDDKEMRPWRELKSLCEHP